MGKRINFQYVKEFAENQNYKLLSKQFINAKTKLKFLCDKNHEFEMTWNNFQQGQRCPKCGIEKSSINRTKTNQSFLDEVLSLVGDEYTFLEEYTGGNKKIKVRHNICGYEYKIFPAIFLNGRRCPVCQGRGNFRNTYYLKEEIDRITNGEYELVGEYTKTIEKTQILHKTCGNIFDVSPNNFINNSTRCPICFGTHKKNTDIFIQEVCELVGSEYNVISKYIDAKHKIMFIHNKCGFEFDMLPNAFLRGQRCPKCAGFYKTTEEFKNELYLVFGEEYSLIGEYSGSHKKIMVRHNICGHVYKTKPYHILAKHGCPKCFKNEMVTDEEFKQRIFDLVQDEYIPIEEYKGANTKVLFKHIKCGNEYLTTPSNFYSGCRCPICSKSKGEDAIAKYLKNNNYLFDRQFRFKDCVGKRKMTLPFDFVVFDNNNNIILLIEYDGEHHFKPVRFNGMSQDLAVEKLEYQKEKDNIKNIYCKNNNIQLLRIPYWDFDNIENILSQYLS